MRIIVFGAAGGVGQHVARRASVADFLVKAIERPQVYSNTSVGLAPVGA